jgi:predicted transcriptional regulator
MSDTRFTLRLDPELKRWLEDEASRQDRSAAWVAKRAIEQLKHAADAERDLIEDALEEAGKGEFVSREAVHNWQDGWDTGGKDELPAPDVFLKVRR